MPQVISVPNWIQFEVIEVDTQARHLYLRPFPAFGGPCNLYKPQILRYILAFH